MWNCSGVGASPLTRVRPQKSVNRSSGRRFAGRVTQLITGSTGLDEYEWGVTLFCEHPDDVKEIVYTMRYDEASAQYGEFGPFYVGMVESAEVVLDQVGA